MLSLMMALVSVCASAQVYIGGTAGISSNTIGDGDSKTAYKLIPEIGYQFNNKWDAGIEVGIQKGEVCKISPLSTSSNLRKAHLLIVNISRAQAFSATGIACALFLCEISIYMKPQ